MSDERRKKQELRAREAEATGSSLTRKLVIGALIAVVFAGVAYMGLRKRTGRLDAFAKCLTAKNAKMYGAYWCPHCQDQKEMFGSSFQYAPYVECGIKGSKAQAPACLQAGVKHYPTWFFQGDAPIEGTLPLQTLAEKSGCPLP
jgi:hypothetical protein